MPMPSGFAVKNGSKTSKHSSGIPIRESRTATSIVQAGIVRASMTIHLAAIKRDCIASIALGPLPAKQQHH